MLTLRSFVMAVVAMICVAASAETTRWASATVDNDTFVGTDNGYTNGLNFSLFKYGRATESSKPGLLARTMLWSLDVEPGAETLEAFTLGQFMVTPSDITIPDPAADDVPYSGTLFISNSFLAGGDDRADLISATLGLVGPSSGAASVQTWFHEVIDADDPRGWDSQLNDEVVFQVARGRLWRIAVDPADRWDVLTLADAGLGTLSSQVAFGTMVRFGRDLRSTFALPLLGNSRAVNPVAIDGSWYVYLGARYEYTFNQIFTDGNTFEDSPSISYDRSQIGFTTGLAYSWRQFSVTLALTEGNVTDSDTCEFTRFGTFTLGWQF